MPSLRVLTLSFLLLSIHSLFAQDLSGDQAEQRTDPDKRHLIGVQWELPVQYGLRYDFQFSKSFSASLQAGLLRDPNSTIIIDLVEAFGTDPTTIDLISSAFQSGIVIEQGINYHFGRNYAGIFFQQVLLRGEETPAGIVELVLNEDLSRFPSRRVGNNNTIENELLLKSNLFQVGIQYGRIFPLNTKSQLFLEFGVSLNVGSKSTIESEVLELSSLNQELDIFLDDVYSTYAYVPTITLGWARKF